MPAEARLTCQRTHVETCLKRPSVPLLLASEPASKQGVVGIPNALPYSSEDFLEGEAIFKLLQIIKESARDRAPVAHGPDTVLSAPARLRLQQCAEGARQEAVGGRC